MLKIAELLGRRVLIVGAERSLMVDYLYEQGCRVYEALDGREALYKIPRVKPELVLMQISGKEGLQTCHLMQANSTMRKIPVLLLAAAVDPEARVEGLLHGAADYISKPFNLNEVGLRMSIHLRHLDACMAQSRPNITYQRHDEKEEKTSFHEKHPVSGYVKALDNVIISLTRNFLLKKMDYTPELQEIADFVGTNTRRLNEAFKRSEGTTVLEFLRKERMKEACMLLTDTSIRIKEISLELGFSSGANFSTAFKSRFGISPREFRRCGVKVEK